MADRCTCAVVRSRRGSDSGGIRTCVRLSTCRLPPHTADPSAALETRTGCEVWLAGAAQPSASFKLRGMGLAAERAVARGARGLVSSSGGNAGYAVAWAGRSLDVPVTVVVPTTTGNRMRKMIAEAGATVHVAGDAWDEAHAAAITLAADTGGALLHPFDHPDIWEGHSTMMTEVAAEGLVPSGGRGSGRRRPTVRRIAGHATRGLDGRTGTGCRDRRGSLLLRGKTGWTVSDLARHHIARRHTRGQARL